MTSKQLFFIAAFLLQFSLKAQASKENNLIADGNELHKKEAFSAAEGAYRKALSMNEVNAKTQHNIGNSLYRSKAYEQAYQRYFQSQKNSQDRGEKHLAFHNMGNSFMQQKQYEKAVEAYKNALRNNPTDDETRYNYALAKELLEKEQQEQEQDQDQNEQQDQNDQQDQQDENKDDSEGDNKEQPSDEGDQDENEKNKEDQKEQGDQDKDKQDQNKDKSKNEDQDQKQQPRKPGQLSPEQIKSLLEAMNQQEKNVQDKVNEEKVKGIPVKTKKDW